MTRPIVLVCHGRYCRHHAAYDLLCEGLKGAAEVEHVRCQRICDGPVAGVAIDGMLEWFERLRSEKAQRRFVDLVTGRGHMRPSLAKRRVGKRAGRRR